MSVVRQEIDERLRLGGVAGPETSVALPNGERVFIRRLPGVLVFDGAPPEGNGPPAAAVVHARVDRKTGLVENDGAADVLAPTPALVTSSGGRTLTFVAGPPGTITASTGSFLADGYLPGMRVVVLGTSSNDGTYTIVDVTALVLTVAEALAGEGPLSGGETLDGIPNLVQGYAFEQGPFPASYLLDNAVIPGARLRTFHVTPTVPGRMVTRQEEVVWAALSPAVVGALAQKGKLEHLFTMPTGSAGERRPLRLRWTGVPVTGAAIFTATGTEQLLDSGQLLTASGILWPSGHNRIVPGSVVVTLQDGGDLLDTGDGRLVGSGGDGVIDYITGAFRITTVAAQSAGAITAAYEHGCLYAPLDLHMEWDALMAQ